MRFYKGFDRGELRGKNAQGVEIAAGLLSTEPNGFDGIVQDYRETHRFDFSGIDADSSRGNVRLGFSHFSGVDPSLSSFDVPIDNRRRFVVLDTVSNEILFSTNDYRSAKAEEVMTAIDSVTPPFVPPFVTWLDTFGLTGDEAELLGDPDTDGVINMHEFFFDSDPTDAASVSLPQMIMFGEAGRVLQYRSASNIAGFDSWVEISEDLESWKRLNLPGESMVVGPLPDGGSQRLLLLEPVLEDQVQLYFRLVVRSNSL